MLGLVGLPWLLCAWSFYPHFLSWSMHHLHSSPSGCTLGLVRTGLTVVYMLSVFPVFALWDFLLVTWHGAHGVSTCMEALCTAEPLWQATRDTSFTTSVFDT